MISVRTEPTPRASLGGGPRTGRSGVARRNHHRLQSREGGRKISLQFRWAEAISGREWAVYRRAIKALKNAGVPFLLGGGFALAAFVGRWRNTKDIDFYVLPGDSAAAKSALLKAGFVDYFATRPYDRRWIYRSVRSKMIVDIIWSMANQRAQVDEDWFARAGTLQIREHELKVVPPEELLWCKLYIMQRDHCDWTDALNLLHAKASDFDWKHLIKRLEEDTPLLRGLLTLYQWLCPENARTFPKRLWNYLQMAPPSRGSGRPNRERVRLLDSRGWFAALLRPGQKLQI